MQIPGCLKVSVGQSARRSQCGNLGVLAGWWPFETCWDDTAIGNRPGLGKNRVRQLLRLLTARMRSSKLPRMPLGRKMMNRTKKTP